MKTKINLPQKMLLNALLNCDAPFLFSIPRPYEDVIIERDKNKFILEQQLTKHYEDLKNASGTKASGKI